MIDISDDVIDDKLIAEELRKILEKDLPPSTTKEEKELYEEIERRIHLENEKLFGEKNASKKASSIGLPMKAKLLAASNLAKSRAEMKAKKQAALAKAAAEQAQGVNGMVSEMADEVSKKYKNSHDSMRKHLEEDGVFTKFKNDDSDSSDANDDGSDFSPMNKLKRSIKKARALSRFEKLGILDVQEEMKDDSDEEMRAVREESEAWLKKQKELEKQLMSKASKGALRQRYMTKGAESHEDVPATEKRIDELLDKVIKDSNLKIKGRSGYGKGHEKRSEGGFHRPRTDMADIVKRAMALRQEVESAGTKDKSKAAKKTAKKPFPVKLETSSSDSHISQSESSSDNEDVSDTSIKHFDMPDLDSASESSEDDTDKLEKYRKRSRPKFDFKQTSIDLTDVDDVMAMEEAKRKLGKKPDLWSSKPPGYKKFEQKKDDKKTAESDTKIKAKLIESFPPEVEALRTKLALGEFGMSNREFLKSDKFLNSKKEILSKSKSGQSAAVKDTPKNDLSSRTPKEPPTSRAESNLSKKITANVGGKKVDSVQDSAKKSVERNKNTERATKLVDLNKRRPSVGSGRTASKFI